MFSSKLIRKQDETAEAAALSDAGVLQRVMELAEGSFCLWGLLANPGCSCTPRRTQGCAEGTFTMRGECRIRT